MLLRRRSITLSGGNPSTYTITDLNANTLYTIRMHMIELAKAGTALREFNAFVQGAQILNNFDIYATTGGLNIPVVRDFDCPLGCKRHDQPGAYNGSRRPADNERPGGIR